MKRMKKLWFFIVAILVLAFSYTAVFGVSRENGDLTITYLKNVNDIRWGIDIQGGVEATFRPAKDIDATDDEMKSAKAIIETRLVKEGITDYELYADTTNDKIIVRFPWSKDEEDFDAETAIKDLGSTAELTFRPGSSYDRYEMSEDGDIIYLDPIGETEEILMNGSMVKNAQPLYDNTTGEYIVSLEFNDEGAEKFAEIYEKYLGKTVSIWMDNQMLSSPTINTFEKLEFTNVSITGKFTAEEATSLATKINAGSLPFDLEVESFGSISPTLGSSSLYAMAIALIIAVGLICIFMIVIYKLPGFVACITLIGQLGICVVAVSGYFTIFNGFTMTLPGIAGVILSMGMGVDANVIMAERIKEEVRTGKTLDGCIKSGSKSSMSAIVDGNITAVIVAVILMMVFGPANILSFIFGPSTTGIIYSFGYTLFVGIIANFIMGVFVARIMLKSISNIKLFRNPRLYGGVKKK